MLTKIVAQLKTGTIKNVVPFGSTLPKPPYVVVKPENDPTGNGRLYRIIVHYMSGHQEYLEDYIFNELSNLLTDFAATSRHGAYNVLRESNDYTDITVDNDDGTISMERCFILPSRLF